MKLYTVKEAAKLLGVSTNTLYKYLDEDRIHAARGSSIQGRFRIPESALEEFLGIKLSTSSAEAPEKCLQTQSSLGDSPASPETLTPPLENLPTGALDNRNTSIPTKIARLLLILALLALLVDLVISTTVSLPASLSRLFFVAVLLILAYQEGGYRRI